MTAEVGILATNVDLREGGWVNAVIGPGNEKKMSQAIVAQMKVFQKKLPGVATPAKPGFHRFRKARESENTYFYSVFREMKTVGFGRKTSALSN